MTRFSIYDRIKELREKQGLTQEEFAAKLHKSREAVKNWEAGIRNLKADDIILISESFGVSADWLLGLSNSPTREGDQQKAEEYTGLSSKAIDTIHFYKNNDSEIEYQKKYISTLNMLLSDSLFFDTVIFNIGRFLDVISSYKDFKGEKYYEVINNIKSTFEKNYVSVLLLPPYDTANYYADLAGNMLSQFLKDHFNITLYNNAMTEGQKDET